MRRTITCCICFVVAMSFGGNRNAAADGLPAIVAHVAAQREPDAVASIPWDAYADAASDPAELRKLPIGVFDSGIGGLTVLEAILKLDQHHNDTGAPGADG